MQRPLPAEERRGRYLGPHTRTASKPNYDTPVSVLILIAHGTTDVANENMRNQQLTKRRN